MNAKAEYLVQKLRLENHPEGGYFREIYRSEGTIKLNGSESGFPSGRNFSTSIYYLLSGTDTSSFHRIRSDETWHFYTGSSATIHVIHPDSLYEALYLGPDLESGQFYQHTVPARSWFGVTVDNPNSYILAGCTVSPGFDFEDFEMGDPYMLKQAFPEHREIIDQLS